jgi:hypothetical protein
MDRIVLNLNIFKGILNIIPGLITAGYIFSIIAVIVVTFVFLIMRFYKNLTTDEGYLMFTLPVKVHQLINSKLIVAALWTILSILAVISSLFVLFASPETGTELNRFMKEFWRELGDEFGTQRFTLILELLSMIFLGFINSILMIYASIAIGHLFHSHKLIGAFAAYIGINTFLQIAVSLLIYMASLLFRNTLNDINAVRTLVFPVTIVVLALLNVIFYLVTNYIFGKKLNLE